MEFGSQVKRVFRAYMLSISVTTTLGSLLKSGCVVITKMMFTVMPL